MLAAPGTVECDTKPTSSEKVHTATQPPSSHAAQSERSASSSAVARRIAWNGGITGRHSPLALYHASSEQCALVSRAREQYDGAARSEPVPVWVGG